MFDADAVLGGNGYGADAFGTLVAMHLPFQALANAETPTIIGEHNFPFLLLRRAYGHPPRRCPGPPAMGTAMAGRLPTCLHGRRDSAIIWFS